MEPKRQKDTPAADPAPAKKAHRAFRTCPVCGRSVELDNRGRLADHPRPLGRGHFIHCRASGSKETVGEAVPPAASEETNE